ncbi:MAG: hypothetical protein MUC87_03165 [Bacteroidia bacterium]|nr:hypothetical protein [Bacteroidia bacterium]
MIYKKHLLTTSLKPEEIRQKLHAVMLPFNALNRKENAHKPLEGKISGNSIEMIHRSKDISEMQPYIKGIIEPGDTHTIIHFRFELVPADRFWLIGSWVLLIVAILIFAVTFMLFSADMKIGVAGAAIMIIAGRVTFSKVDGLRKASERDLNLLCELLEAEELTQEELSKQRGETRDEGPWTLKDV